MRNSIHLCIIALAIFSSISAAAAEKVVLYPLEKIGMEDATAAAIERSLIDELTVKGFTVLKEEDAIPAPETSLEGADAAETTDAETETASKGEASAETAVDVDGTTSPVAAETESTPQEAVSTLADKTRDLGARYYITGSLVRLGHQTTIALELKHTDSGTVSAKKVVARTDGELPRAVQTIATHMAADINRHVATMPVATPASAASATTTGGAEREMAPPRSSHLKFEKNFGLSISQAFSLRDQMYSFTSFNFNGRFEFNQLLLIVMAGFAMGNREFEDGFHFNIDISLAAYLTRTQVAPYLGGGIGLFIGNKLDTCPNYDDEDYYYDECSEDGIVGWEVFPVVGVEMLRNFPVRLHVEARYLLAFNAFRDWGHGPMIVLGVAF